MVLLVWADPPDNHLLVAWLGWMIGDGLAPVCGDWQAGCLQPCLHLACHPPAASPVSSQGGLRVPKAAREDKPQYIRTFQASACWSLAVVPLAKA